MPGEVNKERSLYVAAQNRVIFPRRLIAKANGYSTDADNAVDVQTREMKNAISRGFYRTPFFATVCFIHASGLLLARVMKFRHRAKAQKLGEQPAFSLKMRRRDAKGKTLFHRGECYPCDRPSETYLPFLYH